MYLLHLHPVKIQISLFDQSLLDSLWIAKDLRLLQVDREDSDQTIIATGEWRYPHIFSFLDKNISCGYSLEVPHQGTSNEYPQHMFLSRNKKQSILLGWKKLWRFGPMMCRQIWVVAGCIRHKVHCLMLHSIYGTYTLKLPQTIYAKCQSPFSG